MILGLGLLHYICFVNIVMVEVDLSDAIENTALVFFNLIYIQKYLEIKTFYREHSTNKNVFDSEVISFLQ